MKYRFVFFDNSYGEIHHSWVTLLARLMTILYDCSGDGLLLKKHNWRIWKVSCFSNDIYQFMCWMGSA